MQPNVRYSSSMRDRWIRIDLARQRLDFCDGVNVERSYAISTGARGAGERMGSEQTPRGAHEIKELIGGMPRSVQSSLAGALQARSARPNCVHRIRSATGSLRASSGSQGSRKGAIWAAKSIRSLATSISMARPIPGRWVPLSHGCIRMRNQDVVELFELVRVGMRVQIEE